MADPVDLTASGFTEQKCTACRKCEDSDFGGPVDAPLGPAQCAAECMLNAECEGFCYQHNRKRCIMNSMYSRPFGGIQPPLSHDMARVDPRYVRLYWVWLPLHLVPATFLLEVVAPE